MGLLLDLECPATMRCELRPARASKRRRRLEGQSATDREVERAMTRDRVNKKNALDRYMKTASFLELPDEGKENAKKTFIAQWTEQK